MAGHKKDLPAKQGELVPELPKPAELAKLDTDEKLARAIHEAIDVAMAEARRAWVDRAARVGGLLLEAQARLKGKGESFKDWLARHEIPRSTAYAYIDVAEQVQQLHVQTGGHAATFRPVSIKFAIACAKADREAERQRDQRPGREPRGKAKAERVDAPPAPKPAVPPVVDAEYEVRPTGPKAPAGLIDEGLGRTPRKAADIRERVEDLISIVTDLHGRLVLESVPIEKRSGPTPCRTIYDQSCPKWTSSIVAAYELLAKLEGLAYDLNNVFGEQQAFGEAQTSPWFKDQRSTGS